MESLTAPINVKVDKNNKDAASAILKDLGLNMSTAINMFLAQIVKTDGIPFAIKNPKPSEKLIQAIKEADDISSGKISAKGYHDIDQMFEESLEKT